MKDIIMDPKEYIDEKIDGVKSEIKAVNTKLDAVKISVEGQYKGLESKMDGLNYKLDAVLIELKAYRPLIEQLITLYNANLEELKELRKERKIGFASEEGKAKSGA